MTSFSTGDDIDTFDTPGEDDMLHINWENGCYLPVVDGSGSVRETPVYGSTEAWIRPQEDATPVRV